MTEALFHGKLANAEWDSTDIAQVVSWSFTATSATADSTVRHDTSSGRTRLAGLNAATATVTAKATGDFLPAAGAASAVLILERSTTGGDLGFIGSATCVGATQTVGVDGVDEVTYEFQYTGAVTDAVT